jgi:hypothetical protein
MSTAPGDRPSAPHRFDWKNVAVGTVVSALLVGLSGAGVIVFVRTRAPAEEIGAAGEAMLLLLVTPLAAALGGAFTARKGT